MNLDQRHQVQVKLDNMLEKRATCQTSHLQEEFLSNVFLVGKKGGGNRPVINLKHLNQIIPYQHFKMEGLFRLREMLQKDDFICKLDMKDAFFSVPLHQSSRKYIRFLWSGSLYEFLCLCFGLDPAPRIFTKLIKVPISVLSRINIRVIIYLDDMLLMGQTMEEILMSRDTTIFLLQHLGFILNMEKSILNPVQEIEFLGLTVNPVKMTLSLSEPKIKRIQDQCQDLYVKGFVTVLELTKLIGLLASAIQAVLPAQLNFRYLQQQQINALKLDGSYQEVLSLTRSQGKNYNGEFKI